MTAKESEVRDWLTRMEKHRAEIASRLAKKRKVNSEDGGAGGDGAAAAPVGGGGDGALAGEPRAEAA
eukprot:2572070-Pyramimonas_sp.AAC.1